MVKEILTLFLIYLLILLQVSFFPRFNIKFPFGQFGAELFNLGFLFVVLVNLFGKIKNYFGILSAFWAGLLADVFSESLIGFHILIFLLCSLFIKYFLKRYVQFFWKRKKLF